MFDEIMKQLKGMCNQALVMLVISVLAVAKCLLDGKTLLAMLLIINAIIVVMVLNCLCTAECSNLAWLFAILNATSVLGMARIVIV
jgi:hypothetical protein